MPIPAALPKGKRVSVAIVYGIPEGDSPYIAHVLVALGKRFGWKMTIFQATAQTQQADLVAMQQALLGKPTAIIGVVVPGVWVGSDLREADSEGIITVNVYQDSTTGPGWEAWVPAAEGVQKSLMAAYEIKATGGKANTLLVNAPGFSDANMPAAAAYLKSCSACTTKTAQLNPTDFTDPVTAQSDTTQLLASHPGLNYIMWPNGSLPLQPVVSAIAASSSKSTQLMANAGAPSAVEELAAGKLPILVEVPDALLALTAIDDIDRKLDNQPMLAQTALKLPISYWTKADAPSDASFTPITKAQLATANFLAPFEKAWGMSLTSTVLGVSS